MHVNGLEFKIELITGSENSVVGSSVWEKLGYPRLHGGPTRTAYSDCSLYVYRTISVSVIIKGIQQQLELVVVRTKNLQFSAVCGSNYSRSFVQGCITRLNITA